MKRYKSILIFAALLFAGFAPHAYAEEITPQFSITVDPDKSEVHRFDVYHGETVLFEVTFKRPSNETMTFFWQEQGMGDSYWSESCTTVGDGVYRAAFTPQMDTGAKVFNCFIGRPGMIYRAVFQLRMKQSPGALPNALPLPTPVIDFSRIHVLNPPWGSGGGGCDSNAVAAISSRVDSLETAADSLASSVSGLASSVSGLQSSKADRSELGGYLPLTGGAMPGGIYARNSIVSDTIVSAPTVDATGSIRLGSRTYYLHNEDECLADDNGKFAHVSDISSAISAENPTFSNAAMAVTQDFKTNTYTKTETDALIAANKPEYEDVPSNVVWRIEAEGGRFFFKPLRPINLED